MEIDVYSAWQDYRRKVTDYILKHCTEGGRLAIFGAGKSADLDLAALSQRFDRILLIDRDEAAMKQAVTHYDVMSNCQLLVKDFVGLYKENFAKTSEYCSTNVARYLKAGKLEEFGEGLCKIIAELYEENKAYKLDFSDVQADYVVTLGTHSQLNNSFSAQWMVYRQMLEKALGITANERDSWIVQGFDMISEGIENLQRKNTDYIIERFDTALLSLDSKRTLMGLETGNTGVENSVIDGAYNGLLDIEKRMGAGELEIVDSASFVWPFDISRGILYDISILCLLK